MPSSPRSLLLGSAPLSARQFAAAFIEAKPSSAEFALLMVGYLVDFAFYGVFFFLGGTPARAALVIYAFWMIPSTLFLFHLRGVRMRMFMTAQWSYPSLSVDRIGDKVHKNVYAALAFTSASLLLLAMMPNVVMRVGIGAMAVASAVSLLVSVRTRYRAVRVLATSYDELWYSSAVASADESSARFARF